MIYIEFDAVARLVYKFNHDPSFNGDLPDDGIEHIYVDSFEAFVRDFETFMEEHGRKYNTFFQTFFLDNTSYIIFCVASQPSTLLLVVHHAPNLPE